MPQPYYSNIDYEKKKEVFFTYFKVKFFLDKINVDVLDNR